MSALLRDLRAVLYWTAFTAGALAFGAAGFGAISLVAGLNPIDIFTGAAGRGPPAPPITTDAPATPAVSIFFFSDSSTARLASTAFNGDQDDTHATSDWKIGRDTEGAGSCSALTPVVSSLSDADSLVSLTLVSNDSLKLDTTYVGCVLHEAAVGGDSEWSAMVSVLNNPKPAKVTTLSIVAATDSSITAELVAGHNGHGEVAFVELRYKNTTGDSATFVYWGDDESSSVIFDSTTATAIGDTVQYVIPTSGTLTASNQYEVGATFYRGFPNIDRVVGPLPSHGDNTATGTTTGDGPPPGPDPQTPTLSTFSSVGLDSIQMGGSGFAGTGPHDSTRWIVSANANLSSPILDEWVSSPLVSRLYINAALVNGGTYYGGIAYAGAEGISSTSAVRGPITNQSTPPPGECAGPNEPAGFTQVTCRDFQSWGPAGSAPAGENGWWEFEDGYGAGTGIVEIDTPSGDSSALESVFISGTPGGARSLTTGYTYDPPTESIYMAFYFKVSSNFYNHQVWQKIGFLLTELPGVQNAGEPIIFGVSGSNLSSTGQLWFRGAQQGTGVSPFWFEANVASADFERDTWIRVEMHVIAEQGEGDGVWKMWVNSNLTSCYDDVSWNDNATGWRTGKFDNTWGGLTQTLPAEQSVFFDQAYISKSNVTTYAACP